MRNKNSWKTVVCICSVAWSVLFLSCSKNGNNIPPESFAKPYFGFNAKGSTNTAEQVALSDTFLNRLPADVKKNLAIRVTGGTLSQTTYPANWTDVMIQQWVSLQQKHLFRLIFVVNGNDAPQSQAALIQRWISKGAKFDFLEMMNETYLPKYLYGDTANNPEVTEAISPEKYADTILPNFWTHLDQFNLPYYVCLARNNATGNTQQQALMDHWNDVVINAIKGKFITKNVHATIHLYSNQNIASFDYNQVNVLRQRLPLGRHIAITEAGIIDDNLSSTDLGNSAVQHYRNILNQLNSGDYLFDQVLYAPEPNNNTSNLSSLYGITAKGNIILDFIQTQF